MSTALAANVPSVLLFDLPVRADYTMDQPLHAYTAADHAVWRQLFERQRALLATRACRPFLDGLDTLRLSSDRIPAFADLNRQLHAATGWQIVAVPGLLPDAVFFEHLAHRRFPVTWWMRRADQLDYLEEPDCFHDLFGHVPLLLNPEFADFIQRYGELAGAACADDLALLARLYWYTVEFGLIHDPAHGALRIFGAGIVSSKGESLYSLESPAPHRVAFDLARVMRTEYKIDSFQTIYFVIDSFDAIIEAVRSDVPGLLAQLRAQPSHSAGTLLAEDRVLTRGIQRT